MRRLLLPAAALLTLSAAAAGWLVLRGPATPEPDAGSREPTAVRWTRGLQQAREEAAQRGVDLLLWFRTRSDDGITWRGAFADPLASELFDRDDLCTELARRFVLVQLTYRHDEFLVRSELPHELAPLLAVGTMGTGGGPDEPMLATERSVHLPEVVLVDRDARVIAIAREYEAGGAEAYRDHLIEGIALRERRDDAFLRARAATGAARAAALAEGLAVLDSEIVADWYAAELAEVVALDADGAAGLRDRHGALLRRHRVRQAERDLGDVCVPNLLTIDPRRLREEAEPVLRRHADLAEARQLLAWYQALAASRLALDARDAAPIVADLEAARLLAPQSEVAPLLERASEGLRRFRGR